MKKTGFMEGVIRGQEGELQVLVMEIVKSIAKAGKGA